MDTPIPLVLFTLEGRQEMISRLKPLNLLACERGFLDHDEGCAVTDVGALNILQQRERQRLQDSLAFNDATEKLLDRILQKQAKGLDALALTGSIDSLWADLKRQREAAGRQLAT